MKTAARVARVALAALLLGMLAACGGGSTSSSSSSSLNSGTTTTVANTLQVTVDQGPLCDSSCAMSGASSYLGIPLGQLVALNDILYTNVTICTPGASTTSTTACQTIDHVLVDTGSSGLRVLASVLPPAFAVSLPQNTLNGAPLANCVNYIDGSYQFGPVVSADVHMAPTGEVASSVPIQIVGGTGLPAAPRACTAGGSPAQSIWALGAKGILGIGNYRQDCGGACSANPPQLPNYFTCPTTGCVEAAVPLANQLQNPVWMFPQDNNGLVIQLPAVSANGQATVAGTIIFGIGTQSNNGVGAARAQALDDLGNFTASYNGVAYSGSFIDSGSSFLSILDSPTSGLPLCANTTIAAGFYCPASPVTFSPITSGPNPASTSTQVSGTITFAIANANTLINTFNTALNDLGGPFGSPPQFDFGLPIFFGKTLYFGIESQSTPLGPGPYWAY